MLLVPITYESVHTSVWRHTSEWEDRYKTTGRNAFHRYFTFKDVNCANEEDFEEGMRAVDQHETRNWVWISVEWSNTVNDILFYYGDKDNNPLVYYLTLILFFPITLFFLVVFLVANFLDLLFRVLSYPIVTLLCPGCRTRRQKWRGPGAYTFYVYSRRPYYFTTKSLLFADGEPGPLVQFVNQRRRVAGLPEFFQGGIVNTERFLYIGEPEPSTARVDSIVKPNLKATAPEQPKSTGNRMQKADQKEPLLGIASEQRA